MERFSDSEQPAAASLMLPLLQSWGRCTVTVTCYQYHTDELTCPFKISTSSELTFSLHDVVLSINTHGDDAATQLHSS